MGVEYTIIHKEEQKFTSGLLVQAQGVEFRFMPAFRGLRGLGSRVESMEISGPKTLNLEALETLHPKAGSFRILGIASCRVDSRLKDAHQARILRCVEFRVRVWGLLPTEARSPQDSALPGVQGFRV